MSLLLTLQRLLRDSRGATAVEYAVLCAVIFFAIMATIQGMATQTSLMWTRVSSTMQNATSG